MVKWKEAISISSSIIAIISGLVLIFGSIGYLLAIFFGIISPLSGFIISILIAFFLIITIVILVRRKYILVPRPRSDFKLLKKEIIYEYFPDGKTMKYTRKIRLKSLRKDLVKYSDKYHWTGTGDIKLSTPIQGQRLVETGRSSIWKLFDVYFGRPLDNGEIENVEVVWDLFDKEGTAVDFASAAIEEPLEQLVIKVIIPQNLRPTHANCIESLLLGGFKTTVESHDLSFNKKGEVEWIKNKPKLLHTFELSFPILKNGN